MFKFSENRRNLEKEIGLAANSLVSLFCKFACFAFLIFSFDVSAACVYHDGSFVPCQNRDEQTCKTQGGCHWIPDGDGICENCGSGYYCPGDGNNTREKCSDLPRNEYFKVNYTKTESDYETCNSADDCVAVKDCIFTDDPTTYDTHRGVITYGNPTLIDFGGSFFDYGDGEDDFHVSPDSQHKCYANKVNCKLLGAAPNQLSGVLSTTYAYYRSGTGGNAYDGHFWDISECRWTGEINNFSYTNDGNTVNMHCKAQVTKIPQKASTSSVSGGQTYWYTQTPNSNIQGPYYDEIESYYCTACKAGYFVTSNKPIQGVCDNGDNILRMKICQCDVVEKGYYGPGCSWTSPVLITNLLNLINDCKKSCPMGQTTSGAGATSSDACKYTTETKFCDSQGCFTLPDIADWDDVQP